MLFKLPDLPYSFDALEPHFDAKTMEIHHDKHHGTYVAKLNAALEKITGLESMSIEKILQSLDKIPDEFRPAVRNHGGGHYNHSLFWNVLSPNGGGKPSGGLLSAIDRGFGGFDSFKEQFTTSATNLFGSGWVWLGVDNAKKLSIVTTPNQDTPFSLGLKPILGLDIWEHAYYLKYQNRRPEYISAFWNIVSWKQVMDNYDGS